MLFLDALSFGMTTEEASSPAMKRKMVRRVIVPVRNMNAQRYQTMMTSCSTSSSDSSLGSKKSFLAPSVPEKKASMEDGKSAGHGCWQRGTGSGDSWCIQPSNFFLTQFWLWPLGPLGNLSTVKDKRYFLSLDFYFAKNAANWWLI